MSEKNKNAIFVTATELKNKLGYYLLQISLQNKPIIITKHGKPYYIVNTLEVYNGK